MLVGLVQYPPPVVGMHTVSLCLQRLCVMEEQYEREGVGVGVGGVQVEHLPVLWSHPAGQNIGVPHVPLLLHIFA